MQYETLNIKFLSCAAMLAAVLTGPRVLAAAIPHGAVELLAEDQWISPGRQTYLGFKFELEKGWHIYWVNPGDSGQPLQIEWHLPAGLAPGEIEWPAPQRIGAPPIVDFGYESSTTLLVPVRVSSNATENKGDRLEVSLKVLVCREICIPGRAQVSLTVPIKSTRPEPDVRNAKVFAAARQSLPKRPPRSWTFDVIDQKDSFILIANIGRHSALATFFPLEESQVDNSAVQEIQQTATGFRLTLQKSDQLLKPVKRLRGVLEMSGGLAYAIDVPAEKGDSSK